MIHAYEVLLRLYPDAFRRRYGAEMALDFADALDAARAGGSMAVARFAARALGDLAMSVLREWTRAGRLGWVAATAGITLALWGLALRPWLWNWDVEPGPLAAAGSAPPVTEGELLVLAVLALVPIVVVILFAGRLTRTRNH